MTDVLTRRDLLRRAAASGAFLTVPGVLAACGGSSSKSSSSGSDHTLAKTLHFSNWPLYIDVNEKTKSHPTLQMFTKKTGVNVQYVEDINDNATYFGKIQGPLSRGQSIDRDIIVMTDNSRYPSLLIKKGWVEHLNAYKDHVIDQALTVLEAGHDIKCLFTTPKLLESFALALEQRGTTIRKAGITGVFSGGTAIATFRRT